jgi:hypothetical protein
VTGSGAAPEWICLVSKRQVSGADMLFPLERSMVGWRKPLQREYGIFRAVNNGWEM